MPHDILDEALNDAENYELQMEVQNVSNMPGKTFKNDFC